MSDATEPDADAWATACEEDLAAERARRRERYGPPPVDPAAEFRRLTEAVTGQLGRFGLNVAPLAEQARAAVEPVLERNSEVFGHLVRAGDEFAAAFRAAAAGPPSASGPPSGNNPGDPDASGGTTDEHGTQRPKTDGRDEGGESGPSGGFQRGDQD
ncbi:DUF5304 family protein [Streptomyces sp. ACA25]|uniref:DUF5304 family protein n=1 Tax=Streptomyces sp. ACA25 TaxID=3022596 RepID=UPI002307AAD4|nr:DUF5304 family protein [Streptomyces sp. ACA25]MDB1089907.1 DUF5304 family protein [Streptomyces sp. ACA25]